MLKVTCYKCQWSWSYTNDVTQSALDSLEEGASYYAAECPKCRRTNKITVKQLKRALPRKPAETDKKKA